MEDTVKQEPTEASQVGEAAGRCLADTAATTLFAQYMQIASQICVF